MYPEHAAFINFASTLTAGQSTCLAFGVALLGLLSISRMPSIFSAFGSTARVRWVRLVIGAMLFGGIAASVPKLVAAHVGDDGDHWVIVTEGSSSITMSGTSDDIARARALRNQIRGSFIWFLHEGRAYIITDAGALKAVKDLFAPEEELGRQQEELGKKQAALGEKQAELGRQQSQVRVDLPDLTEDLRRIQARMKGAKTQEELSELQSELSDIQSKLGAVQSKAGEEQSRLGEKQSELGDQQSKLGDEQSRLGDEQSRVAEKASKELRQILNQSLKDGRAVPEP